LRDQAGNLGCKWRIFIEDWNFFLKSRRKSFLTVSGRVSQRRFKRAAIKTLTPLEEVMDSNVLIPGRFSACLASLLALHAVLPARALPFSLGIAKKELHLSRPSTELRYDGGLLRAMTIVRRSQPCDSLYPENVVTPPVFPDDVGDLNVHAFQKFPSLIMFRPFWSRYASINRSRGPSS